MDDAESDSVSEFYLACRNGDLNQVEYLLPRLSLYELNQFEPNGSTALHTAAFHGHSEIIKIMMNHGGILTTQRNRYNLTPAEESNDNIRQLLLLPDTIQLRFQCTNDIITLFTPIAPTGNDTECQSSIVTTSESVDHRPDWIDAYDNAHRIALENHEYMRKWLTKIPLTHIINMITTDYLNKIETVLTKDNLALIRQYFLLANDDEDVGYFVYAYTTPTSFFKQINIDLAQRGSDFRFENSISKKYRDDEPPIGFGQYLFAAVIINHPSIDQWRYTGVTYRGMNINNDELKQYICDARILTRSFLSTSKRIDTAFLYLQYNNPVLRPVLCVYRVKQRHTSIAIGSLSAVQGEDEVLIIPFVAFRVVKVDIDRFYVSDQCRVSVIFLDEVTVNEKTTLGQSWPLAAVIESRHLPKCGKLSDEKESTAHRHVQREECSISPCFELYEKHRTNIQLYIEHCLDIYSSWTTTELENINYSITPSLLDPAIILNAEERKWIDENARIFRLHCYEALFPLLTASDKRELTIDDLLVEQRSILILGDPGSGKTTWSRWFMWKSIQMLHASHKDHLSMPLPILIHIDSLTKHLKMNSSMSFLDYLCRVCIDDLPEKFMSLFCEYIVNGHCIIILDGFNTIEDDKQRDYLLDLLIENLKKSPVNSMQSNKATIGKNNHFIILSSSVVSLPEEYFITYTLDPLSFDLITDFIDNWWSNHCLHLENGSILEISSNQWNEKVAQMNIIFERHSNLKILLSNMLILSTICQWLTVQIMVGTSLKNRIHYYALSLIVLFRQCSSWNQVDQNILVDLLADIAVHLQECSSSGIIEKFDLLYKCRASMRTYAIYSPTDETRHIDSYLKLITRQNSVFLLRDTNNYGFLSLPIQHCMVCLYLIRKTNTNQSQIDIVAERFLFYMTNGNFREPLLLALEWISCTWTAEELSIFYRLIFSNINNGCNQHLPLGAMLLMTALPDLQQKPNEKTLKDAFDRFLLVSIQREWFVRFPLFVDYLIDGLNNLPLNIARTWIFHYFQTRVDIKHIRDVLNILTNLIIFFREIPDWLRNDVNEEYSLNLLQYQSRIDYIQDDENGNSFVIDRFLTTISIIDSSVLTLGFTHQSLVRLDIKVENFSPMLLTVLIALFGGLHRFKRSNLDNKDTIVFSQYHMHRDSCHESWLIKYLNANGWTNLPNTAEIEEQIHMKSSDDDSPETIDLFITWLCLKGVGQSWIFHKYMSWLAFQRAIYRFRRLAFYLSEFYYTNYDNELELEAPSTFRDDCLSILDQYAVMEKNKRCSTFIHCAAVGLTRLMTVGGSRSLFYTDGSSCQRMLDLNISDSKLISDLWQRSDLDVATFLPLVWSPFRPRTLTLVQTKYDSDTVLQVIDENHPLLVFGHLKSFLLTLIPRHLQPLFDRFLNLSPSFPFVCLLGEIIRNLCTKRKGGIRFSLLLAVIKFHFEEHRWTLIFIGLLTLVTRASDIRRYFHKFDHFLSGKYGRLPYDEKVLQEAYLLNELCHERQRAEELRKTSTNCLRLYEASITIAVLSTAIYEQDDQPSEIAEEICQTIACIRESILRLHALTIVWQLCQNHTIIIQSIETMCHESFKIIDDQQSVIVHTILFLVWWTTFSNISGNRPIAYQVHRLLDHLTTDMKRDSVDIQQTVCQSLLIALSHNIYPYVRPRIIRFVQNSSWSNASNMSDILQLQSIPLFEWIKKYSNNIFESLSKSTLLASLYLMQLSIDIYHLPTWINMENDVKEKTVSDPSSIEQAAIYQLSISSEHRILSKEAARLMSNLFRINKDKTSNDYHALERLLSKCEYVEKSAQSDAIQWLQYRDHPCLLHFAFHAALLITKYSLDALQICCTLLDNPIDEFRQRAQKCLSSICLLTSQLNQQQFIQLFNILLLTRRTQSILAQEILMNIDVRIDSVDHLRLLFTWEHERIHFLCQPPQSSYYLMNNLELHQQDIKTSLFEFVHLQSSSLDVLECLFDYATEQRTIEEQLYLTELLKFIGRDWYSSLMKEMSICEQKFVSFLIALLSDVSLCPTLSKAIISVLLINRSTVPYVPIFTRDEARQFFKNILIETLEKTSNVHFSDEIVALVIKHYYHTKVENDEYILIGLQKLTNRELIVASADIALVKCLSLKNRTSNLTDFLQLMNGDYIRLYHALMHIEIDPRIIFIIHSITLEFICKYEDELLPLFVEELEEYNLERHSNHIRLACALLDKPPLSTRIRSLIKNEEQLKNNIFQHSKSNKEDRDFCMRFLIEYYQELTINVKEMFLLAMWDQYQIQSVAFKYVANIRFVNDRTIVEDLYQELLASKSFQQRYISGMLLVQLTKFDQVSVYEVQRKLTEAINQSITMNGTILHKGKQNLGQALFNLLTQLSFIADNKREHTDDYHSPSRMNLNWELDDIIDADQYASLNFSTLSLDAS